MTFVGNSRNENFEDANNKYLQTAEENAKILKILKFPNKLMNCS